MKRVKRMRRCCLFLLILVLSLSGCGGKSQGSTPSEPNDTAADHGIEMPSDSGPTDTAADHMIDLPPDLAAFFKENEIEGLEFWILQDVGKFDFSGYTKDPYHLGTQGVYFGKNYDITPVMDETDTEPFVEYFLDRWPDLSDRQVRITRIWITDPGVKIYGLSIADAAEAWRKVLTEKGYSFEGLHEDYNYSADVVADSPDGNFIICYHSNPRSLTMIAPTTNREGIVND